MYNFSNLTVLIVDDNDLYRKFLEKILSKTFGCIVREAKDPQEALVYLKDNKPSLMILDMEMPKMDGYTFLRILRENPKYEDLPVIVCTSLNSMDLIVRLVKLKIADFIEKRSDAKIITTKILKVIEKI
jgi:CheY-like chemotaxis protein